MNIKRFLKYWSLIYGIVITVLLMFISLPKMIERTIEDSSAYISDISTSFFNWNEDPTIFFLTYFIGYALIWWKPLWGSVIVILCSTYYIIISDNFGPLIFSIPTLVVGLSYLWYWILLRKTT